MQKTITKILAIIGAIAACAALLYVFREKIGCLCKKCCKKEECNLDDLEGSVEDAIEEVKDEAEDFVEAAKDKAEEIAEEFKDYADVEVPKE